MKILSDEKYHSDLSFCLRKGAHSRPWKDWFQDDGQFCIITFIGTNILTCTPFIARFPFSGYRIWDFSPRHHSLPPLRPRHKFFCRRGVWKQSEKTATIFNKQICTLPNRLLIYGPIQHNKLGCSSFRKIRDILIVTVPGKHTPTGTTSWYGEHPPMFMTIYWTSPIWWSDSLSYSTVSQSHDIQFWSLPAFGSYRICEQTPHRSTHLPSKHPASRPSLEVL